MNQAAYLPRQKGRIFAIYSGCIRTRENYVTTVVKRRLWTDQCRIDHDQQKANELSNFGGVVGGDANVLIFSGGEENIPRFLDNPPGLSQWPFQSFTLSGKSSESSSLFAKAERENICLGDVLKEPWTLDTSILFCNLVTRKLNNVRDTPHRCWEHSSINCSRVKSSVTSTYRLTNTQNISHLEGIAALLCNSQQPGQLTVLHKSYRALHQFSDKIKKKLSYTPA